MSDHTGLGWLARQVGPHVTGAQSYYEFDMPSRSFEVMLVGQGDLSLFSIPVAIGAIGFKIRNRDSNTVCGYYGAYEAGAIDPLPIGITAPAMHDQWTPFETRELQRVHEFGGDFATFSFGATSPHMRFTMPDVGLPGGFYLAHRLFPQNGRAQGSFGDIQDFIDDQIGGHFPLNHCLALHTGGSATASLQLGAAIGAGVSVPVVPDED